MATVVNNIRPETSGTGKAGDVAIYTIAQYRVRPSGIDKVKQAIEEFVPYVQTNEPGTRMYCNIPDEPEIAGGNGQRRGLAE